MNSSIDKQKGAVMLEAAYILPIILGVILFIVEAVGFALTSFALSDVLTDVHSRVVTEVSEVANADSYAKITPEPSYVSCVGGKVKLNTNPSGVNDLVNAYLSKKKITVKGGSGAGIDGPTVISGFDAYVIKYNATLSDTVVLPTWLSGLLPVSVDTIITIKDSCNP